MSFCLLLTFSDDQYDYAETVKSLGSSLKSQTFLRGMIRTMETFSTIIWKPGLKLKATPVYSEYCISRREVPVCYSVILFVWFIQITRRDDSIQQLEGDLETSRKQLKDAIEEVNTIVLKASVMPVGIWGWFNINEAVTFLMLCSLAERKARS